MIALGLSLALGCGQPEAPTAAAPTAAPPRPVSSWPAAPQARRRACEQEPFPELADLCRLGVARDFAALGDSGNAIGMCGRVTDRRWLEECHFLVAEGLALAGDPGQAVRMCQVAGPNFGGCLDHIGPLYPVRTHISPWALTEAVTALTDAVASTVDTAVPGMRPGDRDRARQVLAAAIGRGVYLGHGRAVAKHAHTPHPAAPHLRTGFALEAARLLAAVDPPTHDPAAIVALWQSADPPLAGDGVLESALTGCIPVMAPPDDPTGMAPLWGNRWRRVGDSPEADMWIAALEAVSWTGSATGADLAAYAAHEDPLIAATAVELLRPRAAADPAAAAALVQAQAHPDPQVQSAAGTAPATPGSGDAPLKCVPLAPGVDLADAAIGR